MKEKQGQEGTQTAETGETKTQKETGDDWPRRKDAA